MYCTNCHNNILSDSLKFCPVCDKPLAGDGSAYSAVEDASIPMSAYMTKPKPGTKLTLTDAVRKVEADKIKMMQERAFDVQPGTLLKPYEGEVKTEGKAPDQLTIETLQAAIDLIQKGITPALPLAKSPAIEQKPLEPVMEKSDEELINTPMADRPTYVSEKAAIDKARKKAKA